MQPLVAVIGNGEPDAERDKLAEEVGAAVVGAGCGLVCGGLGGVMEAASRGARRAATDGRPPIVAILPGIDKREANPHADIVIPTGLGYARNLLVVLAADAVVAIGGQSGTLSEMAHAWQMGKPLCALVGAQGWAAQLAGTRIDDKRSDAVHAARSAEDVEAWLRALALTA
jgi:uncharacterized protein (TIGR00725 family)